jgi:hypothetical protein
MRGAREQAIELYRLTGEVAIPPAQAHHGAAGNVGVNDLRRPFDDDRPVGVAPPDPVEDRVADLRLLLGYFPAAAALDVADELLLLAVEVPLRRIVFDRDRLDDARLLVYAGEEVCAVDADPFDAGDVVERRADP